MNLQPGKNVLLSTVGFENFLDAFTKLENSTDDSKPQSYPPYNIVKRGDFYYSIEIAVAGFSENDIEIISEGKKLSVTGRITKTDRGEFIHRGIASRDFAHEFILAETVIVDSAEILNGLLTIELENKIPDEKKPRKISIGNKSNKLFDHKKAA